MTETTFTIAYAAFSRLVGIVGPCTLPSDPVPAFSSVRIETHDGHIQAVGTDRFTFAVARGEAATPDGMGFLLSAQTIKHILAAFRPARRGTSELAFTVGAETVNVTTQPVLDQPAVTATYAIVTPAGGYPMIRSFDVTTGGQSVPLDPAYLRRLPVTVGEPVIFRGGSDGTRKVCAFYGPDWVIYIMPMRAVGEQAEWAAQWAAAKVDEPVSA